MVQSVISKKFCCIRPCSPRKGRQVQTRPCDLQRPSADGLERAPVRTRISDDLRFDAVEAWVVFDVVQPKEYRPIIKLHLGRVFH